jgi:hypothetical protein
MTRRVGKAWPERSPDLIHGCHPLLILPVRSGPQWLLVRQAIVFYGDGTRQWPLRNFLASMLPERCVRRHISRRPVLRIRRCPAGRRNCAGFKGILHSTEPFLIYFREQAWEALLVFLPFPLRDLESQTCGGLDLGRDDHINWDSMNRIRQRNPT